MAYYKKQKSVSVKAIAIIMLVVLCVSVGVVGWLSDGFKNWDTSTWSEQLGSNSGNGTGANNGSGTGSTNAGGNDDVVASGVFDADGNELDITAPVEFSSLDISPRALASVQSGDVDSIEIEIRATVVPFDAPDKSCTWSIAWLNDDTTQNISEYLTITADGTDSQNATLEVFDAFDFDTAVLTVTTNDGGHTDTAIITYDGAPDVIDVLMTGLTKKSNDDIGDYYEIGCNQDLTFDIELENQFGDVGEIFNDYSVYIEFVCDDLWEVEVTQEPNNDHYETGVCNRLSFDEVIDKYDVVVIGDNQYSSYEMLNVQIVDSQLRITTTDNVLGLSGVGIRELISDDYLNGVRTRKYYEVYTPGNVSDDYLYELMDGIGVVEKNTDAFNGAYFRITVQEQNSGVSTVVNLKKVVSATGVTLSQSEINI